MSVLVNGVPTKEFRMGKGLRQGDPLPPFLFVIIAENLNLMVEEAKEKGLYEGIRIGQKETPISHLQFADDAIFFGKWSIVNLKNLIKLLEYFRAISGLNINLKKSRILVSSQCGDENSGYLETSNRKSQGQISGLEARQKFYPRVV